MPTTLQQDSPMHQASELKDAALLIIDVLYDDDDKPLDFVYAESNDAHNQLIGLYHEKDQQLPHDKEQWLSVYDQVIKTGISQHFQNYISANGTRYALHISRLSGGKSRRVAVVYSDISDQITAESSLQEHDERQSFLLRLTDSLKHLRNPDDIQATATRVVMEHFGCDRCYYGEIAHGLVEIRQDAATEGLPSVAATYDLDSMPIFKKVVESGEPFVVTDVYNTALVDENLRKMCIALQVISFMNIPVIKDGEPAGILCVVQSTPRDWSHFESSLAEDVAERIWTTVERARAEEQLSKSEKKYRTLFDSIDEGYCIIEMIYDEKQEPVDWLFLQVNRAFEVNNGLHNAEGRTIREMTPNIEPKWMSIYDHVAQTGIPKRFEESSDALGRVFSLYAFRIDDPSERRVAVIFMDITARKQAEERLRSFNLQLEQEVQERVREVHQSKKLLQEAEELAGLGSWEHDLQRGTFSCSEGMYRLLSLRTGTEVSPETYLLLATARSQKRLEEIARVLRSGEQDFDEAVEMEIEGRTKVLHLKATVIRNKDEVPVRVLVVGMDITATREIQETIRRMEAEQRLELARQTLNAQEEERRRISESLHNGLGQLLYGIKISMTHLSPEQAADDPVRYEESRKYTDKLLVEAIKESRRISHELVPVMLEDFGLKSAIEDIRVQLSGAITFRCNYSGLNVRLDKYTELAVYRAVQELMLNVVKHSEATVATVSIIKNPKSVCIKVEDNGQGLKYPKPRKKGIGLIAMQNKIRLLNGKMKVSSEPGVGTSVEITIPHVQS